MTRYLPPLRRLLLCCSLLAGTAFAATPDRRTLPIAPAPFPGKIAETRAASLSALPPRVEAPAGAPNILLIMTDDTGFGAASTFGGPIATPALDRLAAQGLLFNRFHVAALCSPSRAALLTGRNHHATDSGVVPDMATGFPGYDSIMPPNAATIARVLQGNGYSTAMFGKHHNTPMWESGPAGPFTHWPLGLGFDYFYGFIGGETNQWQPALVRGNSRIEQPDSNRKDSVLDRFLADDAIRWIHTQHAAAERPFFVYYAPGSTHAPFQAPADWIARFHGRFDQGWDAVRAATVAQQKTLGIVPASAATTPRPPGIPSWDSLTPDQQRFAARSMEVYAGMLAYQDSQIGRILDELERMGLRENTLVMFIMGDNGASSEGLSYGTTNWAAVVDGVHEDTAWRTSQIDLLGSAKSYAHYPMGWAWAMDAPFPWYKIAASHLGGTRNPLVVSWPGHIRETGIRNQFTHLVDIVPTLLEVAHLPAPTEVDGVTQQPLAGTSFTYTFAHPEAPERHKTQYFEIFGNRGIYHDGWWAGTTPQRLAGSYNPDAPSVERWPWELYDLKNDFAQAHNLAASRPDKLHEMQKLFAREARRNHVYPLDASVARVRINPFRDRRHVWTFWGPDISLSDDVAPPLRDNIPFTIEAELLLPAKAGGPLVASGGAFGGWAFYLLEGRPAAFYASSQQPAGRSRIVAQAPLPEGAVHLAYRFRPDAARKVGSLPGGTLTILANGQEVASGRIEGMVRVQGDPTESFDIGTDTRSLVSADYAATPRFNGTIKRLQVRMERKEQPAREGK